MATFSLEIPDTDVDRVTAALCVAAGLSAPSTVGARAFVVAFITSTVAEVERVAWQNTLANAPGPSVVQIT
jgi:siroheme synthase